MQIKEYLNKTGVDFKVFNHPAVFTCKEAEKYSKDIKGIHSKNLLLKGTKSEKFYLVVIPADERLDIKKLSKLTDNNLEFANEEDLTRVFGVSAGAVSPFGLINDKKASINILIDKDIWNSDFVSFHPNINTKTLELSSKDFHKYINSLKNNLKIIN
jgi:Ala-tRNA(Pro) deacylase